MGEKARLEDAIFGLAIGDALGVPFEFCARDSYECRGMVGFGAHNKPAGTWSDDTAMTLATCDSIRACNGVIVPDDMRWRFLRWMDEGAYSVDGVFDVGNTTALSLSQSRAISHERSNGNGSLMRIVPLAFTTAKDDMVAEVSAITHPHQTSVTCCQEYVRIARDLIKGIAPLDLPLIKKCLGISRNDISSSGYVVDTLTSALWCLANTKTFEDCVLTAVNLGEDTDTTASVAGALAGIVYGKQAIPPEWMETLRGKEVIQSVLF